MDYRKFNDTYYVRLDCGDEVVASLLDICEREGIRSATFSGIGGCSDADIQVFCPEKGAFETNHVEGLLELVSLIGNVIYDEEGGLSYHAHALFSYHDDGKPCIAAGHLKSTTVRYTAEIELRPVIGGTIRKQFDPETGTGFWAF